VKPYYEHAGVTIFRGDCREVLPTLPQVDLVLTDPPYGIGRDGAVATTSSHGGRKAHAFMGWDSAPPSAEDLRLVLKSGRAAVLWGGNYFADKLPPTQRWLVWDKGQRIAQSDGELAWTSEPGALRIKTLNRVELLLDGTSHPTQKPLALMRWCLSLFPNALTVLDPYCGVGSALVAAKRDGRRAIGIEIEERYCEIAAKRLAQEILAL